MRLKVEREKNEKLLKTTESQHSGSLEHNSRLSPKANKNVDISQYIEVGGEPAVDDKSEDNGSDVMSQQDNYNQNRSTLSFVERESSAKNSKKKKSRKTVGSSIIQKEEMDN